MRVCWRGAAAIVTARAGRHRCERREPAIAARATARRCALGGDGPPTGRNRVVAGGKKASEHRAKRKAAGNEAARWWRDCRRVQKVVAPATRTTKTLADPQRTDHRVADYDFYTHIDRVVANVANRRCGPSAAVAGPTSTAACALPHVLSRTAVRVVAHVVRRRARPPHRFPRRRSRWRDAGQLSLPTQLRGFAGGGDAARPAARVAHGDAGSRQPPCSAASCPRSARATASVSLLAVEAALALQPDASASLRTALAVVQLRAAVARAGRAATVPTASPTTAAAT